MNAGLRMTVFDVAADDILAARKDPVLRIGVEFDDFVLVDVRNIDRQVAENQVNLIKRQLPGPNVEDLILIFSQPVFPKQLR